MKNLIMKVLLLILALTLAVGSFTGCDQIKDLFPGEETPDTPDNPDDPDDPGDGDKPAIWSLVLSADKTAVVRGDVVTLSSALKAEGEEDIPSEDATYSIVEGADYATVAGNILTVSEGAPDGASIVVRAREGATDSNTVTIKVSVPIESIVISASGVTNLLAGQSTVLNKFLLPQGSATAIEWVVTEGSEHATVAGDVLVISATAPTGAAVKVKAVAGEVESNELSFTVGYPLTGIVASFVGSPNLLAGASCQLIASLDPENATNGSFEWVIVEGSEVASVTGNMLTVKEGATTGATVKVKAVAGSIESNVLSFTVGYPLKGLSAALLGSANVKNGSSAQLSVTLDPVNATNGAYEWVFVEGKGLATVVGNVITVSDSAPIGSTIKVKAVAGDIESGEVTIIVGVPITGIEISSSAPAVLDRGQSYPITLNAEPSGASLEAIKWVVSKGAEYASVSGGILFISSQTPAGTAVEVYAESGSVKSNVLSYTVGVVLESIDVSVSGSSNIDPNGSRVINVTLTPANASDTTVEWVIVSGREYCSISGNVISINEDAPIGAVISFYAKIGEVRSEEKSVTVGTPITGIVIEALGSTNVVKGNAIGLAATLTPSNASASLVEWVIVEGGEYATLNGSTLIVKSDAKTGEKILVKAVFGTVESNAVEFTVMATQEEIQASKFFIRLSASNLTVDKKGATATTLIATIYNGIYQKIDDLDVEFLITEGGEYLATRQNGSECTFEALGHGKATVTVKIVGMDISETATVDVIVPPEALEVPEVFKERPLFSYNFSKVDPFTGTATKLPFLPKIVGNGLECKDYVVSFLHESGKTGDEVAVYDYATGEITFNMTGKVSVNVISDSGSRNEATCSYQFNINEGYNVHTFTELRSVLNNSAYNGQIINFVVLEKPVGATDYEYGYDLVPPTALLPVEEQTVASIVRGGNRAQAVNKSVYLNGNRHKIDASQMRVFTSAEYDAYCEEYGVTDKYSKIGSLLSFEPWVNAGQDPAPYNHKTYSATFKDIEVVGNCPIDYNPELYGSTTHGVVGAYSIGLSLGTLSDRTDYVDYYIQSENLTTSGFEFGMNIANAAEGSKITNVYAYNCYSTGITTQASILTLENIKFGKCGATGIEVTPKYWDKAGVNNDQPQSITFAGTIDASANVNKGDTSYFSHYTIQGYTVPQIITGNTSNYPDIWVSHIQNEQKQFIFVSLLFNDLDTLAPNGSQVNYAAYQEGGIVEITDLPTDGSFNTTHQYVRMPIMVTLPGLGTVQAGSAIFYNMHYAGALSE
ncbi:MAG: Ig-like domain-containing protein [Clostridia bacterium]|nr:Ig-like domain-containing protein [Clostridia bacterium]